MVKETMEWTKKKKDMEKKLLFIIIRTEKDADLRTIAESGELHKRQFDFSSTFRVNTVKRMQFVSDWQRCKNNPFGIDICYSFYTEAAWHTKHTHMLPKCCLNMRDIYEA